MPRGRPRKVFSEDAEMDRAYHDAHRSWDFTDHKLFDAGEERRLADWKRWSLPDDGALALEIAHEIGEGGKHHGQGRIVFRRKYRLAQLKKLWPDVHWEPTKCQADCLYLRKPGMDTVIKVDNRQQGKRVIFAEQSKSISEGATLRECSSLEGANYQSVRCADFLMQYLEPERLAAPRDIHVITKLEADALAPGTYRLNDWRFWNGYDGDKSLYINQSVCKLTLGQLRMVIGNSPFRVGRGRQARYDTIYLSGLTPDECRFLGIRRIF